MNIQGLHHISLIASDAQRTVDFYAGTLGLRLVKKTVNFDDPGSYHLYFGDGTGAPGSVVTFFIIPNSRQGAPGIGGTHHFALAVSDRQALRKWKRYLTDRGIGVEGPLDRHYFESIYFQDPDGTIVEIATDGPGWAIDEPADSLGAGHIAPPAQMLTNNRDEEKIAADTYSQPVPAITVDMALTRGMHHVTAIGSDIERSHGYFGELLGMRLVKCTSNFDDPDSHHWYWGVGDGRPGTLVTYFERDPGRERRARMGGGQTHHFALAVADEKTQLYFSDRLLTAGYHVSSVMDRTYFRSIYSNDPDGHIVEIATVGPGFTVDEPQAELGSRLMLPEWLESRRGEIERSLPVIVAPMAGGAGA